MLENKKALLFALLILQNANFLVAICLVLFGLYALLFKKNLIKMAIGIAIIASGINLFLISAGYRKGGVAPIFTEATIKASEAETRMVLPTPQALTLTNIVISLAVTALMLSLAIRIYQQTGTLDATKLGRLDEL